MPIRFRCRFCNQLMGISRRKAGQMVQCPTCHAQLTVPAGDGAPEPHEPAAPPPVSAEVPPLFERSDFEAFLHNPVLEPPAARAAPPPPPPPPPPALPFESNLFSAPPSLAPDAQSSPHPAGLVLSPTQATWLTVAAILLLALAFGAGLLVGNWMQ